jgi:alpha-glucuronidase
MSGESAWIHPAWLPAEALRSIGSHRVSLDAADGGPLTDTVAEEIERACALFGGTLTRGTSSSELAFVLSATSPGHRFGDEGFSIVRREGVTTVTAEKDRGLLYGFFHVVRLGEAAFGVDRELELHRPAVALRMLDHWDNIDVHPVMGQVERGYAGGSLFWQDGALRRDLTRVRRYARLLAACGVNAVAVNNVNVHTSEAHLLTDRLGEVAALAERFRPYGIRTHLSVNFASPIALSGLPTADPLNAEVRAWWSETTRRVYGRIPDFGGYVVKADSEGQPGPSAYPGRSHADGANLLADALAPFGGVVHWRAFVYNHRQDWRDRSTDRARAAHDHFTPLDGRFRDNVILQVKHGPIDFQAREPVSPLLAAMPSTRLAAEFQATQEYTGQQKHVCYLAPLWAEALTFEPWGANGPAVADILADRRDDERDAGRGGGDGGNDSGGDGGGIRAGGGLVGVANVGDDPFWTGHPLAQANLYAFGRLAWDPRRADPTAILDEWIGLTFPPPPAADPESRRHDLLLRETLHAMMDESRRTYERYTAPLGIGFMVRPGHHYGPDVDGYEYTPWGTYHFADRDGIGVDRSRATGTGYAAQYPKPWSEVYESVEHCPDELLLFFHHVPYAHVLHSGATVIQHIYDTHFAGVEQVHAIRHRWQELVDRGDVFAHADHADHAEALCARVSELLDEQVRSAEEWRDQINTYFLRKSGVPDAHGRDIHR